MRGRIGGRGRRGGWIGRRRWRGGVSVGVVEGGDGGEWDVLLLLDGVGEPAWFGRGDLLEDLRVELALALCSWGVAVVGIGRLAWWRRW